MEKIWKDASCVSQCCNGIRKSYKNILGNLFKNFSKKY